MPERFHSLGAAIEHYTVYGTEHDIWTGPVQNSLPYITFNYFKYSVARYIYCKFHDKKDELYDLVWNTCGVFCCIKPEHLAMHPHPAKKISVDHTTIREQYWKRNIPGAELARRYGVSRQRIHQIVHGGDNA